MPLIGQLFLQPIIAGAWGIFNLFKMKKFIVWVISLQKQIFIAKTWQDFTC